MFCLCVHVCAHVCVWLVCFCVQCCVLCVCGCVWLDWLKVTQLACESGLSRAQTTGLSKKPQPSSQMLADVLPDGLGETCEQAGAVISLPRGSRDEPVVSLRGRQRPPRPQTGHKGNGQGDGLGVGVVGGPCRGPWFCRYTLALGRQGCPRATLHHVTTLHCRLRKLGTCCGRAGGVHRDLTRYPALLGTLVRAGIAPHRSARQRPNSCPVKTRRAQGQQEWGVSQGLCSKPLELMVETEFLRCLISRPKERDPVRLPCGGPG